MELLYADDLVIICETEKLLNELILSFERATQAWSLTLSFKKTKILRADSDGESVSEQLDDITMRVLYVCIEHKIKSEFSVKIG